MKCYTGPSIVIWAGHVVRMWKKGIYIEFLWGSHKERDHWEGLEIDVRIILK
jgi:hypothetical protein